MEEKEHLCFRNEVACLSGLDHPNILKMYHFYEDPKRYMLITDKCSGGDLYSLIIKKKRFD